MLYLNHVRSLDWLLHLLRVSRLPPSTAGRGVAALRPAPRVVRRARRPRCTRNLLRRCRARLGRGDCGCGHLVSPTAAGPRGPPWVGPGLVCCGGARRAGSSLPDHARAAASTTTPAEAGYRLSSVPVSSEVRIVAALFTNPGVTHRQPHRSITPIANAAPHDSCSWGHCKAHLWFRVNHRILWIRNDTLLFLNASFQMCPLVCYICLLRQPTYSVPLHSLC